MNGRRAAGTTTELAVQDVWPQMQRGDVLVDGGNANYKDSQRRAAAVATAGVQFVDCGVSGGVWGLDNGYALMFGGTGEAAQAVEPFVRILAPAPDRGWLLWSRGGALLAQRLDTDRAMLTGTPLTLGDRINEVSTASSRLIAYRAMAAPRRQLTWVDRNGVARGTVGEIENADLGPSPRVSPDGTRIAVTRLMQGNDDVWILEGGRSSRLTFDPASDSSGVWSPDGSRMAFYSTRTGVFGTFLKLTSGVGADEQLIQSNELAIATSWSPDGRFLLYFQRNLESQADLWVWPVTKTAADDANSPRPAPFGRAPKAPRRRPRLPGGAATTSSAAPCLPASKHLATRSDCPWRRI